LECELELALHCDLTQEGDSNSHSHSLVLASG